jgi:hypothetical protein
MLLGVFYAVIDVWKLQRWSLPLVWIGTNAITLYMARNMVDFNDLATRIIGLTLALGGLLYRHKVFLRL